MYGNIEIRKQERRLGHNKQKEKLVTDDMLNGNTADDRNIVKGLISNDRRKEIKCYGKDYI